METKNKQIASNIVIILLMLVIIALAIGSIYTAYARYKSVLPAGNSTGTVAKWSFKVNINGETEEVKTINLADTMNENTAVVSGLIAPGTSGSFGLDLDATECEVAVEYTIKIDLTNKPTNLIFYADDTYTNPLTEEEENAILKGSMNLLENGEVKTETIYWNWPYQTGESEEEKKQNDEIDTTESTLGDIELPITVIAIQKNPNAQTLADVVSVGDYVNYNAASGNGAGKSYTTDSSVTGSTTTSTFSSSDTMKWKVMSVDKVAGTVELMAEDPTANTVTLYGKTGYKNAETVLNKVGAVYGHGKGATGGRSITVEDVNKLENYTPTDDTTTSYTYTSGTFINEDGTEIVASTSNSVTMSYTASTATKSTNKLYSYTTTNFSGKTFLMASRCIYLYSDGCDFYVRYVYSGDVYRYFLSESSGMQMGFEKSYAALPVVSLKSNIQTSGQDESGAWNLIVE